MSGKVMSVCPCCKQRAAEDHEIKMAAAARSYAHVTQDEYNRLVLEADRAAKYDERTLAESYSVYGATHGTVVVEYEARCTRCGLAFSFTDKHPVPGVEAGGGPLHTP